MQTVSIAIRKKWWFFIVIITFYVIAISFISKNIMTYSTLKPLFVNNNKPIWSIVLILLLVFIKVLVIPILVLKKNWPGSSLYIPINLLQKFLDMSANNIQCTNHANHLMFLFQILSKLFLCDCNLYQQFPLYLSYCKNLLF